MNMVVGLWVSLTLMTMIAIVLVLRSLQTSKSNRFIIVSIIVLLPIVAFSLYYRLGASQQLIEFNRELQRLSQIDETLAEFDSPEKLIVTLQERAKEAPDDFEAWYWLGRVYFSTDQFHEAAQAFAKANQLKPNNPYIMSLYAQSLFISDNNQLTEQSAQLVEAILQVDNTNAQALNLLALDAYHRQDYERAIQVWQQMRNNYSEDSPDARMLDAIITEIEKEKQNQVFITP